MKIKPYVEKLNSSEEYKKFMAENSDAFMVAGFFIIDFEAGNNLHQIDYYVPSTKEVAAFTLDDEVKVQSLKLMNDKAVPEKLDSEIKIDLDELRGIIQDEMKNRKMTEELRKMIAIIQNIKGKKVWNINCVLSGMEVLKAHVEDDSKTVLSMDKISIMDIVKKIPKEQLIHKAKTKEELQDHIERLDKIEEEIEKEKSGLKEELSEKEKSGKDEEEKHEESHEQKKEDIEKKIKEALEKAKEEKA